MSQTNPDSGQIPETEVSSVTKIKCPRCGETRGARVKRHGFIQKEVLPFFGYFPWECGACRFAWVSTERGERRKRNLGRSARAYKEPSIAGMYPDQPLTFKPTVPTPAPAHTSAVRERFDNRFDDDTHEDVG